MTNLEPEFSYFNPDNMQNAFIQGKLPWLIITSYLMFVKVVGPRIMKDRKPFDPRTLMLTYDFVMVVLNVVLCYYASLHLLELWPYQCDLKNSPVFTNRQKFYFIGYYTLLVKFAELLDTVFFVVRKKSNQVSFLHVSHHSMMCAFITYSFKYDIIGYYLFLVASVNSGVHILLYSYYGLSILYPDEMMKTKKYITTVQITQFCLYMTYMLYSNWIGCGFKFQGFDSLAFFFTVAMTALFYEFYQKTYRNVQIGNKDTHRSKIE